MYSCVALLMRAQEFAEQWGDEDGKEDDQALWQVCR
jgi:hypothetical protein